MMPKILRKSKKLFTILLQLRAQAYFTSGINTFETSNAAQQSIKSMRVRENYH